MTPVDDALDIRAALVGAAADVGPTGDLAARARSGGARRLRRRRRRGIGAIAAVVATVTVVVLVGAELRVGRFAGTPAGDPYGQLFATATRGDLADDVAYRDQVLRVWRESHRDSPNADRGIFDDLRGEPRVVWAGTTPVGRAALVAQQAYLHEHSDLSDDDRGLRTLVGFVGVDAQGRPTLVADTYGAIGSGRYGAWFVDPARTTVVVLDEGEPRGISTGWRYAPDGRRSMEFTPVRFNRGAAAIRLAAGTDPRGVRVARLPFRDWSDGRHVAGSPLNSSTTPDRRLQWHGRSLHLAGTEPVPENRELQVRFIEVLDRHTQGIVYKGGKPLWLATGRLPDGRTVVVGEDSLDDDPSQAYALLTGPAGERLVHGGAVDPGATLPVAFRLPDGLGWAIAHDGALLRWRTGAGAWVTAGRDAALLPPAATAVQVTLGSAPPTVVTLPAPRGPRR